MNESLVDANHLVVRRFLSPVHAARHANELREYVDRAHPPADGQCPRSPSVYNFLPFVELLLASLPRMNEVAGATLFPTYCYARSYAHGEVLAPHVDRPASEVSITVHLASDHAWPLHFSRPDGTSVEVGLEPGDGVVYLGCASRHWRDAFQGTSYQQVFLHYVRSRGLHAGHCFDNRTPEINGVRY